MVLLLLFKYYCDIYLFGVAQKLLSDFVFIVQKSTISNNFYCVKCWNPFDCNTKMQISKTQKPNRKTQKPSLGYCPSIARPPRGPKVAAFGGAQLSQHPRHWFIALLRCCFIALLRYCFVGYCDIAFFVSQQYGCQILHKKLLLIVLFCTKIKTDSTLLRNPKNKYPKIYCTKKQYRIIVTKMQCLN